MTLSKCTTYYTTNCPPMPIEITHDGEIDIATGRSRNALNWRNRATTWSKMLDRMAATQRTHESHAEYLSSKKQRQDEIKDVGGFVGGYLAGGKRGKGTVSYRTLVSLDIDFGPADIWEDFTLNYSCAAAVYSTHKHGPGKPRLRIIIPLDRHVLCDEYEAIARRVAGTIGIEYFDDTTYQPFRLMYWPSTSKDGEFVFDYQDGAWLCADEVLASYRDWRDSSEWPVSDREGIRVLRDIKKQGDPHDKHGIVGAFCRTFTIQDAIATFLADTYSPCDVDGRYTFAEGSTAGGLVVYEDKYAYSHHGTDPTSMQLCNAFDLVRLHLFGLRDENVREGTPVNKTPSHIAMEELASKDATVRKALVTEKLAEANIDFAGLEDEDDSGEPVAVDDSWQSDLACDKKGNILSTVDNAVLILSNAPNLKGCFAYDEFMAQSVLRRSPPWRKIAEGTKYVTDQDEDNLYHHLEKVYGMNATKLEKALNVVYTKNAFHPVRDYLRGLKWDGVPRLDRMLVDYLGAKNTEYVRAVTRKTFVAAVARVMQPGVKFDNVLMLLGEEGKFKSTLFNKMGGAWFSDNFNFNMVKSKEAAEQLQGYWLVEVAEMGGFKAADRKAVKAFISRCVDSYRPAFGRNTVVRPRQCIMVSAANEPDPLHENDGNRRMWPVAILATEPKLSVKDDLTSEAIGQLWAEAQALYKKGEPLYLSAALEKAAKVVQKEHTEEHPWTGMIARYLDALLPENWGEMNKYERTAFIHGEDPLESRGVVKRQRVCIPELWCEALGRNEKDLTTFNTKDLHTIMRSMEGWVAAEGQLRYGRYGPQRKGYVLEGATVDGSTPVLLDELHKN